MGISTHMGTLVILGLEEIRVYIACCENTVAQKIATRPIMELCLAVEWKMGIKLLQIWLEQPTIRILGVRAEQASSEMGEETGMEESEGDIY